MKAALQTLLQNTLTQLAAGSLAGVELPTEFTLERTRDAAHGDFATNLAMLLAKPARRKPRELAELIIATLPPSPIVRKVEIAGPGFINFFLDPSAQFAVVGDVLTAGDQFGRAISRSHGRLLIEFVSANPTGPMHVGHGRNAAFGDALANILDAAGYDVLREYYINDAGRQVDVLTLSLWLRYLQATGVTLQFPKRAYPGDYLQASVAKLRAEHGDTAFCVAEDVGAVPADTVAADDASDADKDAAKQSQEKNLDRWIALAKSGLGDSYLTLRRAALEDQLAAIRSTLDSFGVRFDHWQSEAELVQSGDAARALEKLRSSGQVYEQDGALWFRTSAFGDEKDRVLIKADGAATYFANDLAYHVAKLDRGYPRLLDVWGADHHGYIARVRAAIEALTGTKDALDVQLIQFVTLANGRMGKRSGNFVTLQNLIDEAGKDATRFFYLMRSHDQHLEFDIDLARSQSNDNPVFYVQYAHARICRVFEQLADKELTHDRNLGSQQLGLLTTAHELALAQKLAQYPEIIQRAATIRAPHLLTNFLRELADGFHSYYNAQQFLVDDVPLRNARLNLVAAVRQTLANALKLLGVSAPEKM